MSRDLSDMLYARMFDWYVTQWSYSLIYIVVPSDHTPLGALWSGVSKSLSESRAPVEIVYAYSFVSDLSGTQIVVPLPHRPHGLPLSECRSMSLPESRDLSDIL